jgi:hypothetical protein
MEPGAGELGRKDRAKRPVEDRGDPGH